MEIFAMMDWAGSRWPFMVLMMLIIWAVLAVVAVLVYSDAKKRGMNGLLWLVLLLIPMFSIVALIIYLVLRESGAAAGTGGKSAMMLLDERYARGEISRDEYIRMKTDISQNTTVEPPKGDVKNDKSHPGVDHFGTQ